MTTITEKITLDKNQIRTIKRFHSENDDHLKAKHEIDKIFIDKNENDAASEYLMNLYQVKIKKNNFDIEKYYLPFDLNQNFQELAETVNLIEIANGGHTIGATVLEFAMKDIVIYEDNSKKFYFFNGNYFEDLNNIYELVHYILYQVIKTSDLEKSIKLKAFHNIEKYNYKNNVIKEFSVRDGIYFDSINWDEKTKESLTLIDSVADFSGNILIFRKGYFTEFRKQKINLFKQDFENNNSPEKFIKFLKELFSDQNTFNSLLYILSVFFSGISLYRKIFIFWGKKRTGKSTIISLIENLLPELTANINPELLLTNKNNFENANNPSPEIMKFAGGIRVVIAVESEIQKKFNSAIVKNLTGGDKLRGRNLFEKPKEFNPTHQLVLVTNFLPHFNGSDGALEDRICVIPFKNEFSENSDKTKNRDLLLNEILTEKAIILKYLINKYIDLKTNKKNIIPVSQEMQELKSAYVKEENDIGNFISECCEISPENWITKDYLYKQYCDFIGINENALLSIISFSRILTSTYLEITTIRKTIEGKKTPVFKGIKLKDAAMLNENLTYN